MAEVSNDKVIESFARLMRLGLCRQDPECWGVDAFEIYSPQHEDATADDPKWQLYLCVQVGGYSQHNPPEYDMVKKGSFDRLPALLKELARLYCEELIYNIFMDEALYGENYQEPEQ